MKRFEFTVPTNMSFDHAVAAVQRKSAEKGFRVLHTHNVAATLAGRGFQRDPLKIVEICNAGYAHQVLQRDVKISLMLPCPISVYLEGERTHISTMLPTSIVEFFPDAGIGDIAAEVENAVVVLRIDAFDYGDAPSPYPTLLADDGARHEYVVDAPFLGSLPDAEPDGLPSVDSTDDDLTALADEDADLPGVSLWPAIGGTETERLAFAEYHASGSRAASCGGPMAPASPCAETSCSCLSATTASFPATAPSRAAISDAVGGSPPNMAAGSAPTVDLSSLDPRLTTPSRSLIDPALLMR